jgi:hypothetical protein
MSCLFPIDNAERYIQSFATDLERHGNCLRWPSHDVMQSYVGTFDGLLVSELVTLTHTSVGLAAISPMIAAQLNKWATISSIVGPDSDEPTRHVWKVGIFSNDRPAAERVYAPLLCTESAYIGWDAAQIVRGQFERRLPTA